MTPTTILIEKLRDELLFPILFPVRNSVVFTEIYLDRLRVRLYNKKPIYPYPIRYIPRLEDLPFCEDIVKSVEGGEKEKNAAVVAKILDIFWHDREIITRVMKIFNYRVGTRTSDGTFLKFCRGDLDRALQELSREEGDGRYIITVSEVPNLKSQEGIDFMTRRLAYEFGARKRISGVEELIESFIAKDSGDDEGKTLGQEKQESYSQVEEPQSSNDVEGLRQQVAELQSPREVEELRSQVEELQTSE